MSLLPFDPMGPRALSLVLLALIILVTVADDGPKGSSFISNNERYVNCYGADAKHSFQCQKGRGNSISGGSLSVATTF